MKKINHKILMPIIFCLVMVLVYFLNREKPEENISKNQLKFNERVEIETTEESSSETSAGNDINLLDYEGLLSLGLTKSVAQKIIDYRDFTGTIKSFDELKRIKGFGEKTLEKVKKILILDKKTFGKKTKLNINSSSDDELLFYGFNKKELEKINKWKEEKGTIFSNIDLIRIIGEKRYDMIKNEINY